MRSRATACFRYQGQGTGRTLMADVEQLAAVDKLGRRIAMLSRLLHVHPEATSGRAREQGNGLTVERQAEGNVHPLIRRA
mgnify:CR=1 FL=1